jgi:predicted transcriptional regulator
MAQTKNIEEQDNMVLRTVYFPIELDEELKQLAFARSTSKSDLIRRAVKELIKDEAEAETDATG